jgi:DNA repair photolyase
MQAITESKGAAKEYNRLSCNLCFGCSHACDYCYAAKMAVRFGWFKSIQDFQQKPFPREGIIEALEKDAKKWSKKAPGEFVLLSFMTDPYQEPLNSKYKLARQAIEILHKYDLGVNILTKGIITDFDLLGKRRELSKVGITITGAYKDMEPNAATPVSRYNNIQTAKLFGIKTWCSYEPVIEPDSVLWHIQMHYAKFDEIKIGKWNYSPEAKKIDWYKFGHEAEELCQKLGVKYMIKADLRKEMKSCTAHGQIREITEI